MRIRPLNVWVIGSPHEIGHTELVPGIHVCGIDETGRETLSMPLLTGEHLHLVLGVQGSAAQAKKSSSRKSEMTQACPASMAPTFRCE